MKKNYIFTLFLVFILCILSSCNVSKKDSSEPNIVSSINPSKEITSKEVRLTSDFSSVVILGNFNVVLEGGSGSINIETSSNIQEYINYSVSNKTLTISKSDLVSFNALVRITINKDNVSDIKTSYGANLNSKLSYDKLIVSLDTASNISLTGKINYLTINITDVSSAVIDKAMIKEALIDVSVKSSLYINLNGTINGNVSDSSRVTVTGNIRSNSVSSDASSKVNINGNLNS